MPIQANPRDDFNTCQAKTISAIQKEMKQGVLKNPQGIPVKNPKQTIAIGISIADKVCRPLITDEYLQKEIVFARFVFSGRIYNLVKKENQMGIKLIQRLKKIQQSTPSGTDRNVVEARMKKIRGNSLRRIQNLVKKLNQLDMDMKKKYENDIAYIQRKMKMIFHSNT